MARRVDEPETPEIYRTLDVYRHLRARPIRILIASTWYYGFHTHRYDNRTVGCPGELICRLCRSGEQKRWAGALVAVNSKHQSEKLFMFTQSCVKALQGASDPDSGLLNIVFEFWRVKEDPRSELRCKFVGYDKSNNRVWGLEAVAHHVERIFKAGDFMIGGSNTPARPTEQRGNQNDVIDRKKDKVVISRLTKQK